MKPHASHRGHSAIEFLLVFQVFSGLLLGLFEMTRIYRAKHVLNAATFAAARTGSLNNASLEKMNAELANGMAPLFISGARSAEGIAKAVQAAREMASSPGLGILIVSPTQETFDQLHEYQWIRLNGDTQYRWRAVIPNDNLALRPRHRAPIETPAGSSYLTIQDANLLKIRSVWCHQLIVPGLDRLIHRLATLPTTSEFRQTACNGVAAPMGRKFGERLFVSLSAHAVVRLQSPFARDETLDKHSGTPMQFRNPARDADTSTSGIGPL